MVSINLKLGQWWVLGIETTWTGMNEVGRGKLVGHCEEQDSGGGGGVGIVPRGTVCLGNGSEGGFLL